MKARTQTQFTAIECDNRVEGRPRHAGGVDLKTTTPCSGHLQATTTANGIQRSTPVGGNHDQSDLAELKLALCDLELRIGRR